jgi:nitrogen fixation NifU-like protein
MYSATLMDHFTHPRTVGRLEPYDASGTAGTPGNGPFVEFTARLADECVVAVRFQTFGCGPAIAASSLLTELVVGCRLSDTATLTAETLVAALGGLPEDKRYCADLAVAAWRDLLAGAYDAGRGARKPWPK